jgi:hypothetical protein
LKSDEILPVGPPQFFLSLIFVLLKPLLQLVHILPPLLALPVDELAELLSLVLHECGGVVEFVAA